MKVLVGIVSKNRVKILPKAIQSALNQSYQDKEVSVFDDASKDDTKKLKENFPQVKWFFSPEPKSYLYARNKFMKETNAQFFCSLDDDAWFLNNDELQLAIDYLNKHPKVAGIAFDILSPDKPKIKQRTIPYETHMFIGCGHILKLSAVKQAGYYEKNPGFYGGEEKDLCIKLIDLGYSIVKMPGLHVWHDKTNVARDLPKQHRSGVCNDMVFAFRRTPLILLLPVMLMKPFSHLKFSATYKYGILLLDGTLGILDFFKLLFLFQLSYKPVSMQAYKKFNSLSK